MVLSLFNTVELYSEFRMRICVFLVFVALLQLEEFVKCTNSDTDCPVSISRESILVEYGDRVEVTCSITAKPSSQYRLGWETSFNPVQTEARTSVVWTIPSVTQWELSRSKLFCYLTIETPESQCQKYLTLTLYKRPDSVRIHSGSNVWSEGQKFDLKCEIKNVGPVQNLTVQWIRVNQGSNTTINETTYGKFTVSGDERESVNVTDTMRVRATSDEDGVQYRCAALLNLSLLQEPQVGLSEPLRITVNYKPRITQPSDHGIISINLTEGDTLILNCSAYGKPDPQYTLISPQNSTNSSFLIINQVSSKDHGQYNCTAYNKEGSDSVTWMVTVSGKYVVIIIICVVLGVVLLLIGLCFLIYKCYQNKHRSANKP